MRNSMMIVAVAVSLAACGQSADNEAAANAAANSAAAKKPRPAYCFFQDADMKDWKAAADKDGNVVVTTKIKTKRHGRPYSIEVDYVLVKDGDKLRAWDVKTDGVGLVENYRTQFNKIIEKEGFDGLITRMKKKQSTAT